MRNAIATYGLSHLPPIVPVAAVQVTALAGHTVSTDGNTLTLSTNAALTVDGYAAAVGDLIAYIAPSTTDAGIYEVVQAGSVSTPWILTRAQSYQVGFAYALRTLLVAAMNGNRYGGVIIGFWPSSGGSFVFGTSTAIFFKMTDNGPTASYQDATGTPGAATMNVTSGRAAIAGTASSVVITNSFVTATSVVSVTYEGATLDATMTSLRVVAGAGSFTVYGNAAATGTVKFSFLVTNGH